MNNLIKRLCEFVMPSFGNLLRRVCGRLHFIGPLDSWAEASAICRGYNSSNILEKVLDSSIKVKNGYAKYERDSVTFDELEYSWHVTAALMWAAAKSEGRLNVLDFGGSLGSSYFQNKIFLDSVKNTNWCIVEQDHFVEAGKAHIQDERLHFFSSIQDCLLNYKPDVILLSSVLQYLASPFDVLQELSAAGAGVLIIDRTPFSLNGTNKICIQVVPPEIYSASYPMWVFDRDRVLDLLEGKWGLVNHNISPEGCVSVNKLLNFRFEDFIFEAK